MHGPRSLGQLECTDHWVRRWLVVGTAGVMALVGCSGQGGANATRTLSCDAHTGLANLEWEASARDLGDSLVAWLSPLQGGGPYPEVLERLRAALALSGETPPERVEGHAFQRAATSYRTGPDFLTRLARTLREEVRARRLTLRDVRQKQGGVDREPELVALALHGLPDTLLVFAGAETILCHEMHLLLFLFEPGYASDLGDLGQDPGPFVAMMRIVHDAGPVGRGIVGRTIRAGDSFPGLAGFLRRVARGLDPARSPESPL